MQGQALDGPCARLLSLSLPQLIDRSLVRLDLSRNDVDEEGAAAVVAACLVGSSLQVGVGAGGVHVCGG